MKALITMSGGVDSSGVLQQPGAELLQPLVADGELGGVQDLRVFPDGRSGPQLGGELFIFRGDPEAGPLQAAAPVVAVLPVHQGGQKKFLFHGLSPESQKSCPRGAQEHCTTEQGK